MIDIFGKNVNLTYNGNERFKTSFGTVFTLIYLVVIFSKGLSDFSVVFNDEISNVGSLLTFADLESD